MRAALTEAQFPFLARLTAAGRHDLAALSGTRVGPGEPLLERGDPVDGAYLVVAGSLRVYYVTAEGREATLYDVEAGGTCILALTSTFSGAPYPAWVQAGRGGGSFVKVPNGTFRRLFDGEAAFREFIFGVLSVRIFGLMQALEEAGSARLEQRIARYLVRQAGPDDTIRVSQSGVASELGTAREVVFRVLRSLVARRLIETSRMCIRIVDLRGLRRVAD
jgi:CRP/FNR family transcriptional regulator